MGRRQFHWIDWIQFALNSDIDIYHSGVMYSWNGIEMDHRSEDSSKAIQP